ncbi:hypothetical protein ACFE04_021124 [Oxalis oulophora]
MNHHYFLITIEEKEHKSAEFDVDMFSFLDLEDYCQPFIPNDVVSYDVVAANGKIMKSDFDLLELFERYKNQEMIPIHIRCMYTALQATNMFISMPDEDYSDIYVPEDSHPEVAEDEENM